MSEKTVLVLGSDGYIGTALVQRLLAQDYKVIGIDSGFRRKMVAELQSDSATKILSMEKKNSLYRKLGKYYFIEADLLNEFNIVQPVIRMHKPWAIVNLAHQPSGPYSHISCDHANFTLANNFVTTNQLLWSLRNDSPDSHYITLGTMGEYSHYANVDIEEGYFTFEHNGRTSEESIFPRRPTSIYHASKVANTYLCDYCTRIWNLRTTDIMQGVVFGLYTPELDISTIYTRFDSDECFGTVLNRFIVQALLKEPLTIYGDGKHKRGLISLNDAVQALMIAIEKPADAGKSRVWNQLSEWHSMNDLADMVKKVAKEELDLDVTTQNIPTLRHESTDDHYYNIKTDILTSLGYVPTRTIEQEIAYCFELLRDRKLNHLKSVVLPKISF